MNINTTEIWMSRALEQARFAQALGEVPVGAVLIQNNTIIATGHNNNINAQDPTEHAEINAIRKAAKFLNNYRLVNCDLYVTLEPCMMCLGAILHSRITNLYYGASDPKTGSLGGLIDLTKYYKTNHTVQVCGNILAIECADLLKNFFAARR